MNSVASTVEMPTIQKRMWLKLKRVQRDLSQADVAKACGIRQMTYSYIEQGRMIPTESEAKAIGDFFDFDWKEFYK